MAQPTTGGPLNPKAYILQGVGINSDRELMEAFELSGATPVPLHMSELDDRPEALLEAQILAFPGGFSFGDHLGSGQILANYFKFRMPEILDKLIEKKVPMIGICNGFQVMVKLGLLPRAHNETKQSLSLIHNNSGKYEDRWVSLGVTSMGQESPWLKGLSRLSCPVRHGEGKLVSSNREDMAELDGYGCLQYLKDGVSTEEYPHNPNGSWGGYAGLLDSSGLLFGLMPHPEVAIHKEQCPEWTRENQDEKHTPCLQLFKNIVEHVKGES